MVRLATIGIICVLVYLQSTIVCLASDYVPRTQKEQQRLARAIYRAEGGRSASRPYGIMLPKCSWDNVEYCKKAVMQTIQNNIGRWEKSASKGDKRDYLTYLWHRYCPPKEHPLNRHWLKNVKHFLKWGSK